MVVKKIFWIGLFLAMIAICSFATGSADVKAKPIVLTVGNWDQNSLEYFTEVEPLNEAYRKVNPDVTIEIENFSNSEEYENSMKIRQTADELPDIFPLKPYMLVNFKDSVMDLGNVTAAKNNLFAVNLAIDGKVTGIPLTSFYEFVYYRKSIFAAAGVTVPQTWSEFINVLKTIKTKTKAIPLAIGLKDAWPNYPFNEYMPLLVAKDGGYNNVMAVDPSPFSPGKPFFAAYKKIDELYRADLLGEDPLSIGFDQERVIFANGDAAVMAAGQWYLSTYITDKGDVNDLGVFFLPVRDSVSDELIITTMADMFYAVAEKSKNKDAAVDFINWFFTDYYTDFIAWLRQGPTMKGIDSSDPFLQAAFDTIKGPSKMTVIPPDGEQFTKIKGATQFDVKKMGQEMYAYAIEGENYFEKMMADWNAKWQKAMK